MVTKEGREFDWMMDGMPGIFTTLRYSLDLNSIEGTLRRGEQWGPLRVMEGLTKSLPTNAICC